MKCLSESDIERNMRQFHLYALRTLRFAALAAHSERVRKAQKEVPFSDLSVSQSKRIHATEATLSEDTVFNVLGNEIVVQNDELAEALKQLPEYRCNIILLKYFLMWSDRQISEAIESYRTTVNYQRYATLKMLRKIYEGDAQWG